MFMLKHALYCSHLILFSSSVSYCYVLNLHWFIQQQFAVHIKAPSLHFITARLAMLFFSFSHHTLFLSRVMFCSYPVKTIIFHLHHDITRVFWPCYIIIVLMSSFNNVLLQLHNIYISSLSSYKEKNIVKIIMTIVNMN